MAPKKLHFTISERKLSLRIFDIIFVIAGLFIINYFLDFNYVNFKNEYIVIWLTTLVVYLLFFGQIFEMYSLGVASDIYLTVRSAIITVIFTTVFYVFTPKISPELPQNRIQILFFSLTIFAFILINRLLYIKLISTPRFFKNILVIAEEEQLERVISTGIHLSSNNVVAYVSNAAIAEKEFLKFIDIKKVDIKKIVIEHRINEILVSSENVKFIPKRVNNQLMKLFKLGVVIRSIDSYIEDVTFKISENQLRPNFYNYFTFSKNHENNLYLAFRQIQDIVFSLIGILLFFIMVPFVFIGNLLSNRGKLLYFQKRVGKRGKLFSIIKFRTMVADAEQNGAVWAQKNDSRITPFGKILRKTRMDEVPQFFNILKGDMSLLGPRPERPEFVKELEKELPFYTLRHVIKPGMTGWAQVMHPYVHSVKDQRKKLMYDLYYIKERSLILDFQIVIKTISTVLFFRGI